jgi:dTDP-4-amino-4,6-dideoxygalactose transaminase
LEKLNIESRPLWKPLHQQPVFKDCKSYCNGISDKLFANGLCLPSGSNMTNEKQHFVIEEIKKLLSNI